MSEPQNYPAGWDAARVKQLIDHYERQSEDEQADEIEAAFEADGMTMFAVPNELADEVRALLARRRSA